MATVLKTNQIKTLAYFGSSEYEIFVFYTNNRKPHFWNRIWKHFGKN